MLDFKIYKFGSTTDGNASMKEVLGGKGANLAEMSTLGLPVPPGFTIPCEASVEYHDLFQEARPKYLAEIQTLVESGLDYLTTKKRLPLLSVRSGARVSMPGMMDTILNVGITSETLPYWTKKLGPVAALDSYRRLIQMYSSVALNIDMELFEDALTAMKQDAGVKLDSELNEDHLTRLVKRYMSIVTEQGYQFPDTVLEQVMGATRAVFDSWNNPRAIEYRKINNIPSSWGTAVTVQSMVFGNLNDKSATGVLFSRNPSTGAAGIVGEYLVNAQGEDVVAGIRTPENLETMFDWNKKIALELVTLVAKLETHYRDMQDIEFTVEDGKLYLLQTRNGKRSAKAAFNIAFDLVTEGLITQKEAASRVTSAQLFSVMQDSIDPTFKTPPTFTGLAAGGGIVQGVAMFTSERAINCKQPCILVRKETDPDDIGGMNASVGILTATGGLTSHAAVVARGMNKTCVVGATSMSFSAGIVSAYVNGAHAFDEGDSLTIDGATGNVWVKTKVPLIAGGADTIVRKVISWGAASVVSDRLELSPLMDEEQICAVVAGSQSTKLHIDTVTIEGKDSLSDGLPTKKRMEYIGAALLKSSAEEFIVDLAGTEGHYSNSDKAFDFMFGISNQAPVFIIASKVSAMLTWDVSVKARTVVKLPEHGMGFSEALKKSGFRISGTVMTFADLLNPSGPMSITDSVIEKIFGSKEAYTVALEAVEKLQGKVQHPPLPVPGYWYEPILKGA